MSAVRALLAGVAAAAGVVAWLVRPEHPSIAAVVAAGALILLWVVTRPLHPPVPFLYRSRVRGAWTDWVERLEVLLATGDPRAAREAERVTGALLVRLRTTRPPRSARAEHRSLVSAVEAYGAGWRRDAGRSRLRTPRGPCRPGRACARGCRGFAMNLRLLRLAAPVNGGG